MIKSSEFDMSNGPSFHKEDIYCFKGAGFGVLDVKKKGGILLETLWTWCACSSSSAGMLGAYFDDFHSISALTRSY